MNENTIFKKALEIFYKTGSFDKCAEFVYKAYGEYELWATEMCKKIDYYLEFLDDDRMI